jgi:uncharacterized alkaline shock family protein YloU
VSAREALKAQEIWFKGRSVGTSTKSNDYVVSDVVVCKFAFIAAQEVDDIRVIGGLNHGVSAWVVDDEGVAISLKLETQRRSYSLSQIAEAVSQNVTYRVELLVGLNVSRVELDLTEIGS